MHQRSPLVNHLNESRVPTVMGMVDQGKNIGRGTWALVALLSMNQRLHSSVETRLRDNLALVSHCSILAPGASWFTKSVRVDSNGSTPSERCVVRAKLVVLEYIENSHSV